MSSRPSARVSSHRLRKPYLNDYKLLHLSTVEAMSKASGKLSVQIMDADHLVKQIVCGEVEGYVIDECMLVLYDVGTPFYSKTQLVEEVLVLKFDEGPATLKDVDDLLMDIMEATNSEGIVVGGALSHRPRALARAYTSLGYVEEDNPQLYKRR